MTDTLTSVYSTLTAVVSAVAPDLAVSAESALSDLLRASASAHADVLASQQNAQNAAYSSTATGAALDQLAQDAGLLRNPAVAASGQATFTGLPNGPAGGWTVPAGTIVSTQASASASPIFFTLQAAVSVPSNGTGNGTVLCQTAGSIGNVVAGAITQFTQVQGIGGVSNAAPFTSGVDQESDSSLRGRIAAARAVLYSAAAVQGAALGVAGCAFASLSDPKDGSGHSTTYAAAQDGTLSGTLQTAVQAAVNAVLPITETSTVAAFPIVYAVVDLSIDVATGYDQTVTSNAVIAAALAYALTLSAGQTISPGPMWASIVGTAGVAGLADYYTTSPVPPPAVGATELFRFLAAPLAPANGAATGSQAGYAITTGTGSLAAGTYYIQLAWTDGTHDSLPSTELAITTSAVGELTFTAPTAFPSNITGLKVFVGTAAGAEQLQATIASAGGTYVLSAAPGAGAAPAATGTYSQPTVALVAR